MSCAVYKYVYNGEIIYVGKSDTNVNCRISAHEHETKFLPYLSKCKIFCALCKNPAHTTILETYLINKYKPILNEYMKYPDNLDLFIPEPQWMPYNDFKSTNPDKHKHWESRKQQFNKYHSIADLQNRIIGALLLLHIIAKYYNEIIKNKGEYIITLPFNKRYNHRTVKGIFETNVSYKRSKNDFLIKNVCSECTFSKSNKEYTLKLNSDLISYCFYEHYREKIKETIQILRLKQHTILNRLMEVNLISMVDIPEDCQWVHLWRLQYDNNF